MSKPSPTLLDEHAAWCEIAMLCEGVSEPFQWAYLSTYAWASGICTLMALHSGQLWIKLDYRAYDNRPTSDGYGSWWWPRTDDGWRSRAKFAWRMAEQCEKEMNA